MPEEGAVPAGDDTSAPSPAEPIDGPSQESSLSVDEGQAVDEGQGSAGRVPLRGWPPVRLALVTGLAGFVALAALCGWLGYRAHEQRQHDQFSALLVEVGKQAAINLTTIDYEQAQSDVQRILDSATGEFYDDFEKRSGPFIDVVEKVQSKTVGTVTEAGLESVTGQEGEVLVAVTVTSSTKGVPDEKPRYWRMRMTVSRDGGAAKVSKVNFIP